MNDRPDLKLVDTTTGEIVESDDREVLIEQLQAELRGKSLQIGKLRREVRELRLTEPEAATIMDVLSYWRERCAPRAHIVAGGKRWEKVRARLKDKPVDRPPWTPEELKKVVDGALLDPWLSGADRRSKGYLDAETIFRDPEQVERLLNLALGFSAKAGVELADLIAIGDELRVVHWPLLLRSCVCDHRRIEHSKADPERQGREPCLIPECPCEDFHEDFFDRFNISLDERKGRR